MQKMIKVRHLVSAVLALGVVTVGLMALAPASGASSSSSKAVTYAEQPTTTPDFIFPFYPGSDCSVANVDQFQFLMYRPLYWYGQGTAFEVNTENSVANQPTYSNNDTTVTLTLKNWKWSNGESVTAQDVLFFMNIYHAQPANYCGYVPGNMPDDVTNVTANGQTVTFTLKSSVNKYWWLYNELSQITPLPVAWDITAAGQAPGSGGCSSAPYGTADAKCTAVYTFLANQAGFNPNNPSATDNNALASYATNPLWAVVDGPWKLSSYNVDGQASFVPNPKYSGPTKATISKFTEIPYTTDTSEFNALVGGNLTIGYLPSTDVTGEAPAPPAAGPNNSRVSANFKLAPLYLWAINYWPYNYNSTGDGGYAGKIFSQAYFRQAMQSLVDQPLYVKKLYKGYAVPTNGPVPTYPTNSYVSKYVSDNPLPYKPSKAKSLLTSHGWKVVPGGTDTCIKPGTSSDQCGAGIPAGTPLNFQMAYATGITAFTNQVDAMKSSWSSEGINVALTGESFNTVISSATPCPQGCAWEMLNWGGGWTFSPDGYPSGDTLFGKGSAANFGNYNPAVPGFSTNQSLITASITTDVSLADWQNFVADQAPDGWQPWYSPSLTEIQKGLSGVTPQNPLWALMPEDYRWSS